MLISDCALLGAAGARPPVGAALTASVSTGGFAGEGDDPAQTLQDLQAFAATEEGRAMMGRSGQPARVRILATYMRAGVLYVLVEDRGRQPIAGVEPRFWRAFMEVNGRMAALSVLGFQGERPRRPGGAEPARRLRRRHPAGERPRLRWRHPTPAASQASSSSKASPGWCSFATVARRSSPRPTASPPRDGGCRTRSTPGSTPPRSPSSSPASPIEVRARNQRFADDLASRRRRGLAPSPTPSRADGRRRQGPRRRNPHHCHAVIIGPLPAHAAEGSPVVSPEVV